MSGDVWGRPGMRFTRGGATGMEQVEARGAPNAHGAGVEKP